MAYLILKKEDPNPFTTRLEIKAPEIAKNAKAGQFVIIVKDEKAERIPLTIAKKDPEAGSITLIFQKAGVSTKKLSQVSAGDSVEDVAGPLGNPTELSAGKSIIVLGGGVGIAEILPVIIYAKEKNNKVTSVLGARSKELLILEEEIRKLSDATHVVTDDGTAGEKGIITEPLKKLIAKEKFDLCYTVGPAVMMKAVCEATKEKGIKTIASLNANMVDATGMCGTCRVNVGGKTKFACVDGPEFNGHEVDWEGFIIRQKRFITEEKIAEERFKKEHSCRRLNIKNSRRKNA